MGQPTDAVTPVQYVSHPNYDNIKKMPSNPDDPAACHVTYPKAQLDKPSNSPQNITKRMSDGFSQVAMQIDMQNPLKDLPIPLRLLPPILIKLRLIKIPNHYLLTKNQTIILISLPNMLRPLSKNTNPLRLFRPVRTPFSSMNNLPPLPTQVALHPLVIASHPVYPMHLPQSWIEEGLKDQVMIFTMDLNGTKTMIILQNQNFLA